MPQDHHVTIDHSSLSSDHDRDAIPEPIARASSRPTAEPVQVLGTRIPRSLHTRLGEFLDHVNALAEGRGVKKFSQRELVELALRELLDKDPDNLL